MAKRLEDVATELRQLVEEEDPVVGAGHLARLEARPAADDRRIRGGVVGGPERRPTDEGADRALGRHGRDDRCGEGFLVAERREETRDRPREEGLAASRRSHEQEGVATGEGDLERPPRLVLAANLGEIRDRIEAIDLERIEGGVRGSDASGPLPSPGFGRELDPGGHGRARAASQAEDRHGVAEGGAAERLDAGDERRLLEARRRDEGPRDALRGKGSQHRQEARDRPDLAAQRELPDERRPAGEGRELLRSEEDSDGDGEVHARPALWQVRRGEIDRDPARRMDEAGVADRSPDPLPCLAQGGIGESHDGEPGQAWRDVHLDTDPPAVEADQGRREQGREHGRDPTRRRLSGDHRELDPGRAGAFEVQP